MTKLYNFLLIVGGILLSARRRRHTTDPAGDGLMNSTPQTLPGEQSERSLVEGQLLRAERDRRADVLLRWQENCDERINRLLLITFVITLFYAYYGILSPFVTNNRLDKFEKAREDMSRIIQQFQFLRGQYSTLVLPPINARIQAASDMGLFTDVIIPAIETRIGKASEEGRTRAASSSSKRGPQQHPLQQPGTDRAALAMLRNDMAVLSILYNEHRNKHVPKAQTLDGLYDQNARELLQNYRRAVGTILLSRPADGTQQEDVLKEQDQRAVTDLQSMLVGGGDSHLAVADDPVNDLSKLLQLERVIKDLKEFDGNPLNTSLCEEARIALPNAFDRAGGIRLGDTLTQSFSPYQILAVYIPLKEPLKFTPNKGIDSYNDIREFLGAPFEVKTIADLYRLDAYAKAVVEKTNAEYQSPVLSIPFINASIDRIVLLGAVPVLMVLIFHLISFYAKRSWDLIRQFDAAWGGTLMWQDYMSYAPYNFLCPEAVGESATRDGLPARSRRLVAFLLKWFMLLGPLSTAPIFVFNLFYYSSRSLAISEGWVIAFAAVGVISFVLLLFEIKIISKLLKDVAQTIRRHGPAAG